MLCRNPRIKMRTFADWNEPSPGNMEMDLVAHCGEASRVSYVHSLVLTDIASGWTEAAPIVVREGSLVVETLEKPEPVYAETGQARIQALRMASPIVCRRLEEFPTINGRWAMAGAVRRWRRRATISPIGASPSLCGLRCGRDERSVNPAAPSEA